MTEGKGFFESLLDFSFRECVTARSLAFNLWLASLGWPDRRRGAGGERIPRFHIPGTSDAGGKCCGVLFLDSLRAHHPRNSASHL